MNEEITDMSHPPHGEPDPDVHYTAEPVNSEYLGVLCLPTADNSTEPSERSKMMNQKERKAKRAQLKALVDDEMREHVREACRQTWEYGTSDNEKHTWPEDTWLAPKGKEELVDLNLWTDDGTLRATLYLVEDNSTNPDIYLPMNSCIPQEAIKANQKAWPDLGLDTRPMFETPETLAEAVRQFHHCGAVGGEADPWEPEEEKPALLAFWKVVGEHVTGDIQNVENLRTVLPKLSGVDAVVTAHFLMWLKQLQE